MDKIFTFKGSIVALITPFNDKNKICKSSLKRLIDYHVINGTSAIVAAGTTGEYSALSSNEYYDMIMIMLELSYNRIPIIVGIGANSTAKAINLIKRFYKHKIVGYLVITPYYNNPSQEGLFQHFKSISENTDIPQILYNVPYRTCCDLLPETVARLSTLKNIIGIKEATGDLSRVNKIKELVNENFILLSGNDSTALDFLQLGGNGFISVTANIAPHYFSKIYKLAIDKKYNEARKINRLMIPLYDKLFTEPNPIPIKWACKKLGLIKTHKLRLPMTSITSHNRIKLTAALKYAGLL